MTPESVAQNYSFCRIRALLLREEEPPNLRFGGQHRKKIRGHEAEPYVLRLTVSGECATLRPDAPELLDKPAALAQGNQLRAGSRPSSFVAENRPHDREPMRIRIRQGLQQYGMHHTEERRIGADAHRQRGNRYRGETRLLGTNAQRESYVLPQRVQKRQPAPLAIFFRHLLHAAQFTPRRVPRFLCIHAPSNIVFRKRIQVRTQLGVQVLLTAALAK